MVLLRRHSIAFVLLLCMWAPVPKAFGKAPTASPPPVADLVGLADRVPEFTPYLPLRTIVTYSGRREARNWQDGADPSEVVEADHVTQWIYLGDQVAAGETSSVGDRGSHRRLWIYDNGRMFETDVDPDDGGRHLTGSIPFAMDDYAEVRLHTRLADPLLFGPLLLWTAVPENGELPLPALLTTTPPGTEGAVLEKDGPNGRVSGFRASLTTAVGLAVEGGQVGERMLRLDQEAFLKPPYDPISELPAEVETDYHYRKTGGPRQPTGLRWVTRLSIAGSEPSTDDAVREKIYSQFKEGTNLLFWGSDPSPDGVTRRWEGGRIVAVYDEAVVKNIGSLPELAHAGTAGLAAHRLLLFVAAAIPAAVLIAVVVWHFRRRGHSGR